MKLNKKRVLSFILSAVMLLTIIPAGVFGADIVASGTCGNSLTRWTLASDGLLTISGMGAMWNYSSSSEVPWDDYRSNIKGVVICNGVTSICSYAFSGCYGLESIAVENGNTVYHSDGNRLIETESKTLILGCKNSVIPNDDSVTSIGYYAFSGCTGLKNITIPDSVTSIGERAFSGCSGLTEITIPDSVTSIGSSAFSVCTGLKNITIPDSVTSIGAQAFYKTAYYNNSSNWIDGVLYIGNHLIEAKKITTGNYTVKTGTVNIGARAFYLCTGLTKITIPDSVTSIGGSAFYGCTGLTSITIPDSVTSIGGSAFYDCTRLTEITIPDSMTSIGSSAFYYCTGLTKITIPDSVTSIGDWAFKDCTRLTSVTIPDSVTSIGNRAFSGCSGLTEITIPDSVTSIGSWAFSDCSGLKKVKISDIAAWCRISFVDSTTNPLYYAKNLYLNDTLVTELVIPDSVTSIGSCAFCNCTGLTKITIPDSVTSIGYRAFSGCSGLTEITIPDSVTSIGDSAFYGCTGLTEITIPDSVTSIGGSAFRDCTRLTSVTIGNGVTSIGNNAFKNCTKLTTVSFAEGMTSIPNNALEGASSVTTVNIPDSLTSIGYYAFSGCTGLKNITIPDSVTSIGSYAFKGCTGLTEITIPDSMTTIGDSAFSGCTGLTKVNISDLAAWCGISFGSIYANPLYYAKNLYLNDTLVTNLVIPGSVASIGSNAFAYCSGLRSVTIKNGVKIIGWQAFVGCSNLENIAISDSVTGIGYGAFSGTAYYNDDSNWINKTMWDGTLYIGKYLIEGNYSEVGYGTICIADKAFYKRDIYSISIPSSVISIGSSCFAESKLRSIRIPDSVTSIGSSAFRNCTGLTSVTIGNGVTSIGGSAFSGCTGLTSVTIGNGVTSIGGSAFSGCTGLTEITIPDSVTSIGDSAFCCCKGLTVVTIPDSVTSIGSSAFGGCVSLKYLRLPNNETNISNGAFSGCSALENVTIKDGITSIKSRVFSGCSSLATITIPASVTSIDEAAFSGCSGLTKVLYAGTEEQWNAINIAPDNDALTGCSKEFNCVPAPDPAAVGVCGKDLIWTLDTNGLLTISGSGKMYDYSIYTPPFKDIDTITEVVIEDGVNSVGSAAFYGCTGLKSVTLSDGVYSIGTSAFSGCSGLTEITIPDSVTNIYSSAFSSCESLRYVKLGSGVMTVGDSAFDNTNSLSTLIIPENVESIGSTAITGSAKKILILNPDITLSDNSISEGTIYGHEDSTAQTYAEQHDLEFVNIDAEPHEHDYFLKEYVEKTSEADGYELWECYCGGSSYKVIIHNYGEWTKLDDDQHQRVCANDPSHVETESHTWNYGVITTAATCAAEGVKTYTCTVCNATKTETIAKDASNHVGERELRYVKAANCGNNGYTGDTYCKGCGAKLSNGRTIPATGNHSWTDGEITTAATCKSTGVKKYTCTVCKKTRTIPIVKDASNHAGGTELRNVKAATCGDDGYTGDTYCKGCGAKLATGTTDPATGNHTWNDGVVTTAATCAAEGVKTFTCAVCKATKTEPIAKDSANHTGGTELKNVKAATCGKDGYTGDTYCKGCNTKLKSGTTIPATGKHTWDAGKVTTAATTTSGGKITYTCTVCGQTKTEDTPKLPATEPTTEPTTPQTTEPTTQPPVEPAANPTSAPTTEPTTNPTSAPQSEPTTDPTTEHTTEPTTEPTTKPISTPPTEPTTESTTEPPTTVDEVILPVELFGLSGDGLTAKETSETLDFASKNPVTAAELIAAVTAENENATVTIKDKDGNELTGDATPGTGSTVTVTVGGVSVTKTITVMGDVDGDGKVNATDARLALRAAAKLDTLEGAFAAAADTDGDDNINATDARMILRAAAKLDDPSAWLRAA